MRVISSSLRKLIIFQDTCTMQIVHTRMNLGSVRNVSRGSQIWWPVPWDPPSMFKLQSIEYRENFYNRQDVMLDTLINLPNIHQKITWSHDAPFPNASMSCGSSVDFTSLGVGLWSWSADFASLLTGTFSIAFVWKFNLLFVWGSLSNSSNIHSSGVSDNRYGWFSSKPQPPPTSPWPPANHISTVSFDNLLLSILKRAGLNFSLRSWIETACRTWVADDLGMYVNDFCCKGMSNWPTLLTQSKSPRKCTLTPWRQKVCLNLIMNFSCSWVFSDLESSPRNFWNSENVSHAKRIISSFPWDKRPIVWTISARNRAA